MDLLKLNLLYFRHVCVLGLARYAIVPRSLFVDPVVLGYFISRRSLQLAVLVLKYFR